MLVIVFAANSAYSTFMTVVGFVLLFHPEVAYTAMILTKFYVAADAGVTSV